MSYEPSVFLSVCHTGTSEVEKTLMKELFSNYNLKVRPAISPEHRVVVRVGMILSSFVGLVRHETLKHVHSVFLRMNMHNQNINKQCQMYRRGKNRVYKLL